jgi:hypothetical protein
LDKQTIKHAIRKFSSLIEINKEDQAYSDFQEGFNKGLDMAKYTFEDHVDKLDLFRLESNRTMKLQTLQDKYNLLIDTLEIKKPNCSEECLKGIHAGFEKSKILFGELIREYV